MAQTEGESIVEKCPLERWMVSVRNRWHFKLYEIFVIQNKNRAFFKEENKNNEKKIMYLISIII